MLVTEGCQGTIMECNADDTMPKSQTQQPAVASQAAPAVEPSNVMTYRSARAMVSDHVDTQARNIIADKLSKLNYVPVRIKGIGGLHDAFKVVRENETHYRP
jgi:hypothetical protein